MSKVSFQADQIAIESWIFLTKESTVVRVRDNSPEAFLELGERLVSFLQLDARVPTLPHGLDHTRRCVQFLSISFTE